MDVALRRLRAEDVEQVVAIEREAFAPLLPGPSFKRQLNNRYARYLVACFPEAASGGAAPTGHAPAAAEPLPPDASLWGKMARGMRGVLKKPQPDGLLPANIAGYVSIWFQGNEAHITEIAVREDLRGNGIGELLLIGAVRVALEQGCAVLTLEARVSNFIAQRLYEKYGFKEVGLRKAYYSDNREDAVIMTTSPIHAREYRELFHGLQEAYLARWGELNIDL